VKGSEKSSPKQGAYTVSTKSKTRGDEIGIQTLVGDYAEKGTNHGKKVYQKIQDIPGHQDIDVLLYFWDQRDGPDFSGWWFGDQIGGSQVWARCASASMTPPRAGWRIPWDAEKVEPGLLLVEPALGMAGGKGAAGTGTETETPAAGGRSKKSSEMVVAVEQAAAKSLGRARAVLANMTASEEIVAAASEDLNKSLASSRELQATLTKEIDEGRRAGPSAVATVTELSRLSPRVRALQTSIQAELTKLSGHVANVQEFAEEERLKSEAKEAELKIKEENDIKDFEMALPAAIDVLTDLQDHVSSVSILANNLTEDLADEDPNSEAMKTAFSEVETAAQDAQLKVVEARKIVKEKLQAAMKYAPEVRKSAQVEFGTLSQKIVDAQKELTPLKTFRQEFHSRVTMKREAAELNDKLMNAEHEVERVAGAAPGGDQLSADEVSALEKLIGPVTQQLNVVIHSIEAKLRASRAAPGAQDLESLKARSGEVKSRLGEVSTAVQRQRDGVSIAQVVHSAGEKVDTAEKALQRCQDAEMPFLKGIEVLPNEESTKALMDCESSAQSAMQAIVQAQGYLKTKTTESTKYKQEQQETLKESFTPLRARLDVASKKLGEFKKETAERKTAAITAEAGEAMSVAEQKVGALSAAVSPFESQESSTETLKQALEAGTAAEQAATTACVRGRAVLRQKQREGNVGPVAATLASLQQRLDSANQELGKMKKILASGEKLIKSNEALLEETERVTKAESVVAKAESLAEIEVSDTSITEMDTLFTEATKVLESSKRSVEAHLPNAPGTAKAALQALGERNAAARTKIKELKAKTKDQRERVLTQAYLAEATKKTADVEAAMETTNEVELPFLKGIEVLPLDESKETIAKSEEASSTVHTTIAQARTYIASKKLEIRPFAPEATKELLVVFGKLTERINSASQRLAQFKKDTEARKRASQLQEAGDLIEAASVEVENAEKAGDPLRAPLDDPLKVGESDPPPEVPEELVNVAVEALRAAQTKTSEARAFLVARQRDAKTPTEPLKKLQVRLAEVDSSLVKVKRTTGDHEKRLRAKELLAESSALLQTLEADIAAAEAEWKPLLEGDKFLVHAAVSVLASELQKHMKSKDLSEEELFNQSKGTDSENVSKEAFVTFLGTLPEVIEKVDFSEERQRAMCQVIDDDEDGVINLTDFQTIFRKKYTCVKSISITEGKALADTKTVGKLEPKDVVEALSDIEKDEAMTRMRCRTSTDTVGWVTLQGAQGTVFLQALTPFSTFAAKANEVMTTKEANVVTIAQTLKTKLGELNNFRTGPLADAKPKLSELHTRALAGKVKLEALKKKVAHGKRELFRQEAAEANAHVERKEKRAAEELLSPVVSKVEAAESAAEGVKQAATPFTSLSEEEQDSFATPLSLSREVKTLHKGVVDQVAQAKDSVKEKLEQVGKSPKGVMVDAKKDLMKLSMRADTAARHTKTVVDNVGAICKRLGDATKAKISVALRAEASQTESASGLFKNLASGGDSISLECLIKKLSSLDGVSVTAEQVQLINPNFEAGLGWRCFADLVQQFYTVVKGIAVTSCFELSKCKTIRKSEVDDFVEVLEGPLTDGVSGLVRIRGRCVTDNSVGWITVKGNQGTPFLKQVSKPFYVCNEEVQMDQEVDGKRQPLCNLKPDEVVELLEGPKKTTFASTLRVRVKANGETGWITSKDKKGSISAELGKFYVCTNSVAMTDTQQVDGCGVVKKLDIGELFEALEGPIEDGTGASTVTRVKGKAQDKVGWVTIQGNMGTVFAEKSSKHFRIVKEVSLHAGFASDSKILSTLEPNLAVEVVDGPKQEVSEPVVCIRGRALSDDSTGWVELKGKRLKLWSSNYRTLKAGLLQDAEGEKIRDVKVGEVFELIAGPLEHVVGDVRTRRIHGRAKSDGSTGWLTLRDVDGAQLCVSC